MARALDYVAGMMQWNLNFQLAVPQTDEKWGFGVIRDDWSAAAGVQRPRRDAQDVIFSSPVHRETGVRCPRTRSRRRSYRGFTARLMRAQDDAII